MLRDDRTRVDPSSVLDGAEQDQLRHALAVAARTFREHAAGMRAAAEADVGDETLLTKRGAEQLELYFSDCADRTEALSERLADADSVAFLREAD